MPFNEGGLQWRYVDGIANGKVHGGVEHVAKSWLVVLDGASLTVTVAQENEFMLLASPQAAYTLSVDLQG